jgi:DNA-binding NtrC family response regulator
MSTERILACDKPVLVVDDEEQFLRSASFTLRSAGCTAVVTCQDSREAFARLEEHRPCLVLLDMMMPHITGRELLERITAAYPDLPVIMLTAVNEVEVAVDCIRAGAYDYLVKPVDKNRLVMSIRKALESAAITEENRTLRDSMLSGQIRNPQHFEEIVTGCGAMLNAFRYIEAVGKTTLPLLITGETGCGKELFARAFHRATGRKGEYVVVNAAGLDDTMFSDTLFGHEKGAFTGALVRRDGLVAKATGGTLFLDEIGDLRPESQVKLLRLIDDRSYYPVGSDQPQSADIRIVAATNRDLHQDQLAGGFRKDLYYRLKSHHVHLPPLRERDGDLPLLIDHFIEQAAAETGAEPPTIPPQLYTLLSTYAFPGNVRELRGMVFDAVTRHEKGILSLDTFRQQIHLNGDTSTAEQHPVATGKKVIFGDILPTLREMDELLISEALKRSEQNQSIASRLLGITRTALNKRINHPG